MIILADKKFFDSDQEKIDASPKVNWSTRLNYRQTSF